MLVSFDPVGTSVEVGKLLGRSVKSLLNSLPMCRAIVVPATARADTARPRSFRKLSQTTKDPRWCRFVMQQPKDSSQLCKHSGGLLEQVH